MVLVYYNNPAQTINEVTYKHLNNIINVYKILLYVSCY